MNENNFFNLPPQTLSLPSKGFIYPETSPLSKGTVDIIMPTTKQEDILTNINFIQQGTAIDKFLESILIEKIDLNDMINGDKNALLIGARILLYGPDYSFVSNDPRIRSFMKDQPITIDLSKLNEKSINNELFQKGINEFDFQLADNVKLTCKLLTGKDEKKIEGEMNGLKKAMKNDNLSAEVSLRLKYTIMAVNGNRDTKVIRDFVDQLPGFMSRKLRKFILEVTPGYDMKYDYVKDNGVDVVEGIDIPFGLSFLWPE